MVCVIFIQSEICAEFFVCFFVCFSSDGHLLSEVVIQSADDWVCTLVLLVV